MAIKVYNSAIQAEGEDGEILFELFLFDEFAATLKIDTLVYPEILDELFDAIREGVKMLNLETGEDGN